MPAYLRIPICICILIGYFHHVAVVEGGQWASAALERLDELHDAEIYNAVVKSMEEWQRKQKFKKLHGRSKREEKGVCYQGLGCFDATGPFGYLDMLPATPEEISTRFLLYPSHRRRRSGLSHNEVPFSNVTDAFDWAQQGFNKSLPTKVLIHGFGSTCIEIWVYELKSALMAIGEMNIICVDWGKGAELPNYVRAAANTRLVGKQLSILLKGLIEKTGLEARTMHLIGFSLGAHVAGFAGSEIANLSRITGLDPAGPLFESQDPRARLDQTDADFVDVIHSNGENLILGGLGSWQPMGHVDFYPNGGRMQKGCTNIFVGAVSDIIWSSAIEGRSLCNHRRAYKFFTDSISPRCHFPAFPCESYEAFLDGKCFPCTKERKCGNMGYYADRSKGRGQLYLITRDEEPFCAHQYNVKIESTPTSPPLVSYGKIQLTLVGDSSLNETFTMTKKDDEEMKLGDSISRILVPHPILSDLNSVEVLYTAYSGWLSSGLTRWKVDKITLSDSFGKSLSICKKSLVLESAVAVKLPLYPGDCNLPKEDSSRLQIQDRVFNEVSKNLTASDSVVVNQSKFIPTPVVKIGNEVIPKKRASAYTVSNQLKDAAEMFGLPWSPLLDEHGNSLEEEKESSRALNTRTVKYTSNKKSAESNFTVREVVEPILKPHYSAKNARSHDPDKDKPEISEPILGPTTSKNSLTSNTPTLLQSASNDVVRTQKPKEIEYNFYENDWIPASSREKWKRQDDSKRASESSFENDPINFLTRTVQFLPERIGRMFEQAEKYARETILPLISAHTPKIIRDFIAPEEQPKYVPLHFEESEDPKETPTKPQTTSTTTTSTSATPTTTESTLTSTTTTTATTKSHIQKIAKHGETISVVFPETNRTDVVNGTSATSGKRSRKEISPEEVSANHVNVSESPKKEDSTGSGEATEAGGIYIDLPVFEEDNKAPKYIPVSYPVKDKRKMPR